LYARERLPVAPLSETSKKTLVIINVVQVVKDTMQCECVGYRVK
jgi:hypothetical protein